MLGQAARYCLPPVLLKYRDQNLVIIPQLATGIVHLHRDLPNRVGVGKADAPEASRSRSVPKARRREGKVRYSNFSNNFAKTTLENKNPSGSLNFNLPPTTSTQPFSK